MAQLDFGCSISQGYNFQKDVQTLVGHLVKLKIGDTEITADTDLTDPADNTKSVTVVGPISYIQWQGGMQMPYMLTLTLQPQTKRQLLY